MIMFKLIMSLSFFICGMGMIIVYVPEEWQLLRDYEAHQGGGLGVCGNTGL